MVNETLHSPSNNHKAAHKAEISQGYLDLAAIQLPVFLTKLRDAPAIAQSIAPQISRGISAFQQLHALKIVPPGFTPNDQYVVEARTQTTSRLNSELALMAREFAGIRKRSELREDIIRFQKLFNRSLPDHKKINLDDHSGLQLHDIKTLSEQLFGHNGLIGDFCRVMFNFYHRQQKREFKVSECAREEIALSGSVAGVTDVLRKLHAVGALEHHEGAHPPYYRISNASLALWELYTEHNFGHEHCFIIHSEPHVYILRDLNQNCKLREYFTQIVEIYLASDLNRQIQSDLLAQAGINYCGNFKLVELEYRNLLSRIQAGQYQLTECGIRVAYELKIRNKHIEQAGREHAWIHHEINSSVAESPLRTADEVSMELIEKIPEYATLKNRNSTSVPLVETILQYIPLNQQHIHFDQVNAILGYAVATKLSRAMTEQRCPLLARVASGTYIFKWRIPPLSSSNGAIAADGNSLNSSSQNAGITFITSDGTKVVNPSTPTAPITEAPSSITSVSRQIEIIQSYRGKNLLDVLAAMKKLAHGTNGEVLKADLVNSLGQDAKLAFADAMAAVDGAVQGQVLRLVAEIGLVQRLELTEKGRAWATELLPTSSVSELSTPEDPTAKLLRLAAAGAQTPYQNDLARLLG